MRQSAVAFLLVMVLAFAGHAQSLDHPSSVTPDGASPIPKAAEAARVELLGALELYRLALYVNGASDDRASLRSPDVAKALRIAITFKEDLHRRLAIDWRRELVPRLEPQSTAHLRGTFAPLRYGDILSIEYVPGSGTTVRINRSTTVGKANHELMLPFSITGWGSSRCRRRSNERCSSRRRSSA